MAKRCLIISGGCLQPSLYYKKLTAAADYIICADGGARHAKALGVLPDLVVGDFDTLTAMEIDELSHAGTTIIRYPKDKDFTDTHIALLEAEKRNFSDIDIIAALGGRLDHTLANLMLLGLPEVKANIRILDDEQEVFLIRERMFLYGNIGETISLFPLSERVKGINTKGLKYPLKQGELIMGIPIGVSNEFIEENVEIEIEEGLLLVIQNKKQP